LPKLLFYYRNTLAPRLTHTAAAGHVVRDAVSRPGQVRGITFFYTRARIDQKLIQIHLCARPCFGTIHDLHGAKLYAAIFVS
jgi:hypothetical protein